MKRLALCMVFVAISVTEALSEAAMFPFLYELWKDSAFGKDPKRTERAAWVIQNPSGFLEYVQWKSSLERSKESWEKPLPENLIALVHTHPVINDPRPSHTDTKLARKINIPVYTVSAHGIWRVTPDGTVTRIARDGWFKTVRGLRK